MILLLLILSTAKVFAGYEFKVQPRSYWFETDYDIYSGDEYITTVEKNWLQLRTVWSLCDEKGEYGNGTARLFSPGVLLNSMREIDVVDYHQKQIGYIKGEFWTSASGKFVFYDEYQHPYAVAFIDQGRNSANIVDFHNQREQIALLRRTHVPGGDYFWNVKVLKDNRIDPRTLHVFSAFVTDSCWPYNTREGGGFWENVALILLLDRLQEDY